MEGELRVGLGRDKMGWGGEMGIGRWGGEGKRVS